MPIYEFRCKDCGHEFEKLCGLDETPDECPSCEKPDIKKLISETTFKLKGTGWWETDYNNSGQPEQNDESESSPDEGSADEGTADGNEAEEA